MKKVSDIMTKRVVTVNGEMDISSVARVMDDKGIGSVMVKDKDGTLGILTERDIIVRCLAKGLDPSRTRAGSVMSSPLVSAEPDMPVVDAAKLMISRMIRRLPVIEGEEVLGIVTSMDMVRDVSKGRRKEDSLIYLICDYEKF